MSTLSPDEGLQAAAEIEELTRWAAGVASSDIPPAVLRRAAVVLIDDLAAAVASRDESEVAAMRSRFLASSQGNEASVWDGRGSRADRWTAAAINGITCNWAELDEGYRLAVCHAGLYALPAAVAEAEAEGRTVEQLLTAVVVSYEVAARFATAWTFPSSTLHPHGVFSPLGAATAVGKLRSLDHARFLSAIAGSTTLSLASPFSHATRGVLIRNAWAGAGAWLGARAVDLAVAGIGGSATSAFDVYSRALSGRFRAGALTADLGTVWAISNGYHKTFACCQYGHSAVQACLALGRRFAGRDLDWIERIEVQTHALGMSIDNDAPGSTLAGKFSLQHIVATTLVNGFADHRAFSGRMLDDERVARLRTKVVLSRFAPDRPPPHDRPARVTVLFNDGLAMSEECLSAPGGPDQPLSEETLLAKASSLTADAYPEFGATARQLLDERDRWIGEPVGRLLDRMLQTASARTLVAAP